MNIVRDCEHGQLARSCRICELERELAAAKGDLAYERDRHLQKKLALKEQLAAAQKDVELLFINPNSAAFGNGTPFEEAVINAGTNYIVRTMGHYSTGDRRFTMGLYNTMLRTAIDAAKEE